MASLVQQAERRRNECRHVKEGWNHARVSFGHGKNEGHRINAVESCNKLGVQYMKISHSGSSHVNDLTSYALLVRIPTCCDRPARLVGGGWREKFHEPQDTKSQHPTIPSDAFYSTHTPTVNATPFSSPATAMRVDRMHVLLLERNMTYSTVLLKKCSSEDANSDGQGWSTSIHCARNLGGNGPYHVAFHSSRQTTVLNPEKGK